MEQALLVLGDLGPIIEVDRGGKSYKENGQGLVVVHLLEYVKKTLVEDLLYLRNCFELEVKSKIPFHK